MVFVMVFAVINIFHHQISAGLDCLVHFQAF